MDFIRRLQRLKNEHLKELAALCGGLAVLVFMILVATGSIPILSNALHFALSVNKQPAAVYWDTIPGPGGHGTGYPGWRGYGVDSGAPCAPPGGESGAPGYGPTAPVDQCYWNITWAAISASSITNPSIGISAFSSWDCRSGTIYDSGGHWLCNGNGFVNNQQAAYGVGNSGYLSVKTGQTAELDWSCLPGQQGYAYYGGVAQWYVFGGPAGHISPVITASDGEVINGGTDFGSFIIHPVGSVGSSVNYRVDCGNATGEPGGNNVASVNVVITNAGVNISAAPQAGPIGFTSLVTWSAQNVQANSCTVVNGPQVIFNGKLGGDSSINGNDWTANNFSLNNSSDVVSDSPTHSFATLSSINYNAATYPKGTVQDAGLSANGNNGAASGWQLTSGKWYWEYTVGGASGSYPVVGIFKNTTFPAANQGAYPGHAGDAGFGYESTGPVVSNNATVSTLSSFTNTDVIGVAYDAGSGNVYFSKNGVWQNGANPAAGTGAVGTVLNGYPGLASANGKTYINFGQGGFQTSAYDSASGGSFTYTPPAGFKAVSSTNLAVPTILKPKSFFDIATYAGTASAAGNVQSVNVLGFRPDLVWVKNRTNLFWNSVSDTLRGALLSLFTNATSVETSSDTNGYISAFNFGGFTATAGASVGGNVNQTANNYVAWEWKKTPATDGVDIQTFSHTVGTTNSVPHALAASPDLIIVKNRTVAGNWWIWSSQLAAGQMLNLNLTNGSTADGTVNTVNTTSFSFDQSQPTGNYVAYLFKSIDGFSKIGTYKGDGLADGTFVYTGFKPKYILIKRTDTTGNWYVWDTVRNSVNPLSQELFANLANAESSIADVDSLANGFKLRNSNADFNASGGTYVFAAFADTPFQQYGQPGLINIGTSARFNPLNASYLNRTPAAAATSNQKFTLSFWMKRAALGTGRQWVYSSSGDVDAIGASNDTNVDYLYTRIANSDMYWGGLLRDPSAWMHVVVAVDTTQATAANRVIVYINNVSQSLFSGAYPAQNATFNANQNGLAQNIGRDLANANSYFDGYLSDLYMVDGLQLAPSSFGSADANGYWHASAYNGSVGTNGFHLQFAGSGVATFTNAASPYLTPGISTNQTYTISCVDPISGLTVASSVTLRPVTLSVTVNPSPINFNASSTITWEGQLDAGTAVLAPTPFMYSGSGSTDVTSTGWGANTGTIGGASPPLGFSQPVVINGTIYRFGGNNGSGASTVISGASLNTPTSWSNLGTMPVARQGAAVAVIGGFVYIFGGNDGVSNVSTIYKAAVSGNLFLSSANWSNVGALPAGTPVADANFAIIGDSLYFFGGQLADGITWSNTIWSASAQSPLVWTQLASSLPTNVGGGAAVVVYNDGSGAKVYIIGGITTSGAKNSNIYSAPVTALGGSWTAAGVVTSSVYTTTQYMGAALIGSTLYLFGGRNPSSNTWTNQVWHAPMNNLNAGWFSDNTGFGATVGVSGAGAPIILGNNLYLFGGKTSGGTFANTIRWAPVATASNTFYAYQLPQWMTDNSNNAGITWGLVASTTFTLSGTTSGVPVNGAGNVKVNAFPPTCAFSPGAYSTSPGTPVTLQWGYFVGPVTGASIDNGVGVVTGLNSKQVNPAVNTTYILSISGPGGTATCQATVSVIASAPQISTLSIASTRVRQGSSAKISWSVSDSSNTENCSITSNPTSVAQGVAAFSCTAGNCGTTWSGSNVSTNVVNQPTMLTLSCTNTGGTSSATQSIQLLPVTQEF